MTLPMVLKVVEFAVQTFATATGTAISSIPIIGWIAGIISALIALTGVMLAVYETPAEKLKRTQKALDDAKTAA
jgi:hypothetical protein